MASLYGRLSSTRTQVPPVVGELEAIFRELPDEDLLAKLRGPRRRGPRGYDPKILWRCYVAYYALGIESVSALIRLLQDNPYIARACGVDWPNIPSQPTFSRFLSKLAKKQFTLAVKNIFRTLVRRCYATYPDFAKSVAIDSTDIKAWSNGGKNRAKGTSDPDAGWIIKKGTNSYNKITWGYKVHILADTKYELPIAVHVTKGNVHDSKQMTPLLSEARFTNGKFMPRYIIADSAYSSDKLRHYIRRQYWPCEPIIDPNPGHKRVFAKTIKTPEWLATYKHRSAIERLNARAKEFHRLDSVRVRGRLKVAVHAMLSAVVLQAQALAAGSLASVRKVA